MGHSYALNICNAVSIFLPVFSHCFPIFPIYNILAPRFITSPLMLALASRRNASLREEIAKREAARLQAVADRLQQQAERSRQASAEAAKARLEAERGMREGRRDYFDRDK